MNFSIKAMGLVICSLLLVACKVDPKQEVGIDQENASAMTMFTTLGVNQIALASSLATEYSIDSSSARYYLEPDCFAYSGSGTLDEGEVLVKFNCEEGGIHTQGQQTVSWQGVQYNVSGYFQIEGSQINGEPYSLSFTNLNIDMEVIGQTASADIQFDMAYENNLEKAALNIETIEQISLSSAGQVTSGIMHITDSLSNKLAIDYNKMPTDFELLQ